MTLSRTRLREGYQVDQVDAFLAELTAALGRGDPVRRLAGEARFTPVRLRPGYDMGEVDDLIASMVERSRHPDDLR